jgi:hypothetical protein
MAGEEAIRDRLGEMLVARGHVTEGQLAEAHALQRRRGIPLGQLLVEMGVLTRLQLAGLLTEQWARPALAAQPAPATTPEAPVPEERVEREARPRVEGGVPRSVDPVDPHERLDALEARLDRLEASVEGLAASLQGQEEAAPRQAVEDLRLALRELWKVQKSLLERDGPPPAGSSRS